LYSALRENTANALNETQYMSLKQMRFQVTSKLYVVM